MLAKRRLLSPIFLLLLVSFVIAVGLSTRAQNDRESARRPIHLSAILKERRAGRMPALPDVDPNLAQGLAAWEKVYSVLISPRCINCHTATNYPQQGDDRHRHQFNVVRGPDGRGVPGLACATCHQGATSKAEGGAKCAECHEGANLDPTGVPGGHGWHLAPLSMAWQDRNDNPLSSAQVCRAVTDRSRNMNMGGRKLLKHHEEEELVHYAWNPGRRPDGTMRTVPPLTHAEFVNATRTWVEAGTPCPRGK